MANTYSNKIIPFGEVDPNNNALLIANLDALVTQAQLQISMN